MLGARKNWTFSLHCQAMRIYLVRHGETEWNREEVFRGRVDVPLNENGIRQAERTAFSLRNLNVATILSSPLVRARKTAELISERTSAPILVLDTLTDIKFGVWEGLPLREVERRFPKEFLIWKHTPQRWKVEGAETLGSVRRRVLKMLLGLKRDEDVVIVTHRVVCKVLSCLLLRIPTSRFWYLRFDPCSISIFEGDSPHYVCSLLNDTSHLRDLRLSYQDF